MLRRLLTESRKAAARARCLCVHVAALRLARHRTRSELHGELALVERAIATCLSKSCPLQSANANAAAERPASAGEDKRQRQPAWERRKSLNARATGLSRPHSSRSIAPGALAGLGAVAAASAWTRP